MMSHAEMCNDKNSWSSSVDAILFNNWVYDFDTKIRFLLNYVFMVTLSKYIEPYIWIFSTPIPDNIKINKRRKKHFYEFVLQEKKTQIKAILDGPFKSLQHMGKYGYSKKNMKITVNTKVQITPDLFLDDSFLP